MTSDLPVDQIIQGDALHVLRALPHESVQCVVTSPPYWGLRDYGVPGQYGLERTIDEYLHTMVAVFEEVRRVLRRDGTLWLNLGDSYANNASTSEIPRREQGSGRGIFNIPGERHLQAQRQRANRLTPMKHSGLKHKDLIGVPWRVAFALQADGWYLRSDIIWSKPNPMPESVQDRPTKAHEYLFLMAKSERYYYDADAIRENMLTYERFHGAYNKPGILHHTAQRNGRTDKQSGHGRRRQGFNDRWDLMTKDEQQVNGRNKRDVWTVATHAFPEAHFATFPPALVEPCILAGCPPGGLVLDPFGGSGTVGMVARTHSRHYLLIELNPSYCDMAEARILKESAQPVLWSAPTGLTQEETA